MITVRLVFSQEKNAADGLHPGVNEELYKAVRRVLLCLDALTDFLLTPGDAGEDDNQLRLLQQEVADYNINSKKQLNCPFQWLCIMEKMSKCICIYASAYF